MNAELLELELDLEVQRACADDGTQPSDEDFRRWARAALGECQGAAIIGLRLVDEEEMRTLNLRYRGKDGSTNVLSFPAGLPADVPVPLLGDLAICAPVVAREAIAQGKPLHAHWAHLTVHGTLHLLGHDHIEDDEAERMEALEVRILATLDYPNPYTVAPLEDRTQNHERRSI